VILEKTLIDVDYYTLNISKILINYLGKNFNYSMAVRAKRSLKASSEGIDKANKAVLTFATKLDLAAEVGISRATIQNFFAGKPIGRENFHKICQKLELSWKDIAEIDEEHEIEPQQEINTVSDDTEI
jgi:DNA-binding Xre family transcriptional regulator